MSFLLFIRIFFKSDGNVKLNVFNHSVAHTKSLYISHAVSNFYGTEMEIWAGFGPVDITEKKSIWANYE